MPVCSYCGLLQAGLAWHFSTEQSVHLFLSIYFGIALLNSVFTLVSARCLHASALHVTLTLAVALDQLISSGGGAEISLRCVFLAGPSILFCFWRADRCA